jgi:hypothetical protein
MLPHLRNTTALFEASQTSPAGPSGNSSIQTMDMNHWRIDTDMGRTEIPGEKPVQCPQAHF